MKNTTQTNPRSPEPTPDLLERAVKHSQQHPTRKVGTTSLRRAIFHLSENGEVGDERTVDYNGLTLRVTRRKTCVAVQGWKGATTLYRLSWTDSEREQTPQSKQGFDKMTVAELKVACRTAGIKGYSSMKKNDLIRTLNADYIRAFNGQGEEE